MNSITRSKPCEIADDVAAELRLPWRVDEVRDRANEIYETAICHAERAGMTREQAHDQLIHKRGLYKSLKQEFEEKHPSQRQDKPTPEQIETALGAFPVEQWITLTGGLDQTSTGALLCYIRQHASELKPRFGKRKVERVEGRAIMRDTDLWLRENRSTLVPISDPFWADFWRGQARQANREGRGHTTNGRSIAELNSNRAIARRLTKTDGQTGREMKVNDREVKRWGERTERQTYEEYATERGADTEEKRAAAFIDYYSMIRKPHQRKH